MAIPSALTARIHPAFRPVIAAFAALLVILGAGCDNGRSGGTAQPTITVFTANQQADQLTITEGDSATLAFAFANGAGTIDPNLGPVDSGGSLTVTPAATTSYLLNVMGAGQSRVFRMVTVTVVPPPAVPAVLCPTLCGLNQDGLLALVQPQPGCSYLWTLTGDGAIQGASTGSFIRFRAGGAGTLELQCTVTNAAGKAAAPVKGTVAVQASPITAFSADPAVITAGDATTLRCVFTGDNARIDPDGTPVTSGVPVTFTPPATRRYTLKVFNGSTTTQQDLLVDVVPALADSPIAADPVIIANRPGNKASVPAQTDVAYTWTVLGGTLTAGAGTREITFTAGPAGTVQLDCTVTNGAGRSLKAPTLALPIQGPGALEVTLAQGPVVPANLRGLEAFVAPVAGASYQWSASAGTAITSGTNSNAITFTAPDGGTGTVTCALTHGDGSQTAGSAVIATTRPAIETFAPPLPFVTTGRTAEINCVFTGGNGIVHPGGQPVHSGQAITLGAGSYTLAVTDPAGNIVAKDVTVAAVPLPTITEFRADRSIIGEGRTTQLVATFTGGTGRIEPGAMDVTSGIPVDSPALGTGTSFTLTVRNQALDAAPPEQVLVRVASLKLLTGQPSGPGYLDDPDGAGTFARFRQPCGAALDDAGNLYVADTGNHCIRKVAPDGAVTTLAGSGFAGFTDGKGPDATFNAPEGVAWSRTTGNCYVADTGNNAIRMITPEGVVTKVAGEGPGAPGSDNGTTPGTPIRFNAPTDVALFDDGKIIVADTGNLIIRAIFTVPGGGLVAPRLAGTIGGAGWVDGDALNARFRRPSAIAVDGTNSILVADPESNTIRKIILEGTVFRVYTVAGADQVSAPFRDGAGSVAIFGALRGISVDNRNNAYVTDDTYPVIRKLTYTPGAAGPGTYATATLAGDPVNPSTQGTADGPLGTAKFMDPRGLAVGPEDPLGARNVYIVDGTACNIRMLGTVNTSTVAGPRYRTGSADGGAGVARFKDPCALALDRARNLYVADSGNHTIRRIDPLGNVTTVAGGFGGVGGSFADGTGGETGTARFNNPRAIVADGVGNLYVSDRDNNCIRKITAAGDVTTLAGVGGPVGGFDDTAAGVPARFNHPTGLALFVDGAGTFVALYVADTGNNVIRQIDATGAVTTMAGYPASPGFADGIRGAGLLDEPYGLALDSEGNLLVSDARRLTLRKVLVASGTLSTVAGTADQTGFEDGAGGAARFSQPAMVAMDRFDNLLVGDITNGALRMVSPAGVVSTVLGIPGKQGIRPGALPAPFADPNGIAVDPDTGDIYLATLDAILKLEFQ